jgi:class 3 adenylate cyclase/pimeloyl-ACP methyl ester carboxylesterase
VSPPETRYVRAADGIHIAYQVVGDSDIDLVLSLGFVSHLEHLWEEPALARFLRRLASFTRLIIFDRRGTGMSDRPPGGGAPLLEDRVNDIAAVMDAVGSERAVMMGNSETGAVALLFAATHPKRTRAVVGYGTYGAGGGDTEPTYPWVPDPEDEESYDEIARMWGRGLLFLDDFAGDAANDPHYREWFAKLERLSASPGAAVALAKVSAGTDVRDVLPTISVPTLILHKRNDAVIPLEEGKYIADRVPGAKFVELPGSGHWPWIGDEHVVEEIQEFLTGIRDVAESDRVLATVMFLDVVDSTKYAAEIGDRRWSDLLETFHHVVRREIDRHRGTELDTAGDGFFIVFDGPAKAIRCATALLDAVKPLGIQIRVGIHTGECERVGSKIAGLGVVIGARICSLAGPGEILVSRTVADLVVGSALGFESAGEHDLKGVPGSWRLYRLQS